MSTWIKVDKDGRSYNVAPNATPPSGGGGTLQAYRNSYTKDLVFLPSDDSNKALAPVFTGLSELSCVKNQNNVTIPEQYDFSTLVEMDFYADAVIEYVDPSTGISTIYGFNNYNQVLCNITDPTNIIEVASFSPELNSYEMKLVGSEGIIFNESQKYYFLQFGSTSPVEITISIPSLGELSLESEFVYLNGTYFVKAKDNIYNYYLIYSTDLSNWSYLDITGGPDNNISMDNITYSHGEYIIQDNANNQLLHSAEIVPLNEWVNIVVPDGFSLKYSYIFDGSNIFIANDSNNNEHVLKVNSDFTLSSIGMLPSLYNGSSTKFKISDEKTMMLLSFGHDTTMQIICAVTDKVQLLQIVPLDDNDNTIDVIHITSKFTVAGYSTSKVYSNNSIQYTRDSSSDITL